ncbi:MAG: GNAT family N-acetyltransferase [Alphaproteobacteria bacterium]|nr:GNAT family N-acetyltransferase [Alphaproteobacteria bacterium]
MENLGINVNDLVFKSLSQDDIPLIVSSFVEIGWSKPASTYEKYFEEQEHKKRCIWVAFKAATFAGYVTLKWQSDYAPFREEDIPEICDLNVIPKFRKQGVASTLLDLAETEAYTKSSIVGIGVGLSSDYGKAQKLYVKRGYIPDGGGITSHCKPVSYGSSVAYHPTTYKN